MAPIPPIAIIGKMKRSEEAGFSVAWVRPSFLKRLRFRSTRGFWRLMIAVPIAMLRVRDRTKTQPSRQPQSPAGRKHRP